MEHYTSDYFEKIPRWTADSGTKRFEIMADAFSGRIPVTRLESWRDFTDLLESEFFNRPGVQLVFRGQPAGAEQVEPGRIALMAEELASSIAKNKVVDWETRDTVQARLRNVVRVVLRKYGYPQALRQQVVEQVLALDKLTGEGSAQ